MSGSRLQSVVLGGVGGVGGCVLASYFLPKEWNKLTGGPSAQVQTAPPLVPPPAPPAPCAPLAELGRKHDVLKYGLPSPGMPTILEYQNHVLEYDTVRRVPKWVAEHVSKTKAFGESANRKLARFNRDPSVPVLFTAENTDFWGSGWSRGHMAPAGNNKHSQEAMNQTFYLTNIVPQDLDNNGNYWNRLEIYCRELTKLYSDVYIISGPLWLPEEEIEAQSTPPSVQSTPLSVQSTPPSVQSTPPSVQSTPPSVQSVDVDNVRTGTGAFSPSQISSVPEPPTANTRSVPEPPSTTTFSVPELPSTTPSSVPERLVLEPTLEPTIPAGGDIKPSQGTGKGRPPRPPKKIVKYEVIGNNNVAVPTHLFKIILVEDPQLAQPMMASFIIPNSPVQDVDLQAFEVDLDEVERNVGVRFHQDLDKSGVDRLCLRTGCKLRDYRQFQEFFWTRRLSSPWTINNLEADWREVCKKGLRSPKLEELYSSKRAELMEKESGGSPEKERRRSPENPPSPAATPPEGNLSKEKIAGGSEAKPVLEEASYVSKAAVGG